MVSELIKVSVEVAAAFGVEKRVQSSVNHPVLQAAVFALCGVPSDAETLGRVRGVLRKALAKCSDDWSVPRARLKAVCADGCIADLERYAWPRWRRADLPKLRTLLLHHAAPAAQPALRRAVDAVEAALDGAAALGVPPELLPELDSRLSPTDDDDFDGVLLQVAMPDHGVLLRGGRFDALCAAGGAGERAAAGVTIRLDKVAALEAAAAAAARAGTIEALVCSHGEGLTAERMRLAGELWAAGVVADYTHGDDPSAAAQMNHASLVGAPHVLIVQPGGASVVFRQMVAKARDEEWARGDAVRLFLARRPGASGAKGRHS